MSSIPQKQNLCDYCHQKPKFANHKYCGKTCSQQAAGGNQGAAVARPQPQITSTSCKQCGKNPKFQNFDFCGKNCASAWQLTQGGSSGNPNPLAKNLPGGNLIGQAAANVQIPGQLLGNIPQPLQSQLQAVLPAVVAALQQQGQNQPQQQQSPPSVNLNPNTVAPVPPSNVPPQTAVATTLAPSNAKAIPPQQTNINQNVNGVPSFPAPQNAQGPTNGVNTAIPTSAPGQVQAVTPTTCRLTGCTKPVYADPASNHTSEYCSKRHREEAVITGQVTPCIMCLKMPRGNTDHFCSKLCRDAALSQ